MPNPGSLEAWVDELKNKDAKARRRAAEAIGLLGADSKDAVSALGRAVNDPDEQVASNAIDSLGAIGADAATELPVLIALIRDPARTKTDMARRAANALTDVGRPAVGSLIELLADPNHDVSAWAVTILGRIGPDSLPALPALIREAETRARVPFYESRVADAIGRLGPGAATAAPRLEAVLRRTDLRSKSADVLLCALADIGSPPLQLLLEKALDPGNPSRSVAIEKLGQLGRKAKPTAPVLTALIRTGKDPELIVVAALALCRIDPTEESLLPTAVKLLQEDPWSAAEILRNLGPRARPALSALGEALKKASEPEGRLGLVRALPRIDPSGAVVVSWLVGALTDPDPDVRIEAAAALSWIGPEAAAAAPALAQLVAGAAPEPLAALDPRESAAWALVQIRREARPAVPILIKVVEEGRVPEARRIALAALGGIGSGARDAIPALSRRLRTDDRPWVIEALSRIVGLGDEAFLPVLVPVLREKTGLEPGLSRLAMAVSRMGPEGRQAARAYFETATNLQVRARLAASLDLDLPEAKGLSRRLQRRLQSLIHERDRCNEHGAFTRPRSTDPALDLIEGLSELGRAARPALPLLREIANSQDPILRRKAARAIASIETLS